MKNRLLLIATLLFCQVCNVEVVSADSWEDKLSLGGDFRFRDELIDTEGKAFRHRQRIRIRFEAGAELLRDRGRREELHVSLPAGYSGASSPASEGLRLTKASRSHSSMSPVSPSRLGCGS